MKVLLSAACIILSSCNLHYDPELARQNAAIACQNMAAMSANSAAQAQAAYHDHSMSMTNNMRPLNSGMSGGYGDSPVIYDSQGNYRGKLNSNRYDADSISNPYGRYGSRYSQDSLNNPYAPR